MSGTCKYCGCTEARACDGGCAWIDEQRTICSACLPQLPEEELRQLWLQEFAPAATYHLPPMQLDAMTGFAALAVLQLGLRHPQVQTHVQHAAGFARDVANAIGDVISQVGPLSAEVVRRGFVGCYESEQTPSEVDDGAHASLGEEVSPGGIILP